MVLQHPIVARFSRSRAVSINWMGSWIIQFLRSYRACESSSLCLGGKMIEYMHITRAIRLDTSLPRDSWMVSTWGIDSITCVLRLWYRLHDCDHNALHPLPHSYPSASTWRHYGGSTLVSYRTTNRLLLRSSSRNNRWTTKQKQS